MAFSTPESRRTVSSPSKKSPITSATGILSCTLIFSLIVLYYFTPWPSVIPIRYTADNAALIANRLLVKHVPGGVIAIRNIQYDIKDNDALLDVYLPPQVPVGKQLPLIVWLHGGNWVSGSREHDSSYCKILAAKGFVVAAVNYSLAPEKHYPVPVRQVNAALDFLVKNSDRFSINEKRIFLAGEGAGAQLAAQIANLTVNAAYASLLKIKPALQPAQISGCILYNGLYDFTALEDRDEGTDHLKTMLWCYSGSRNFQRNVVFHTASVNNFLVAGFPRSYLATTEKDQFSGQSILFSERLAELKVDVKTSFIQTGTAGTSAQNSWVDLHNPQGWKVLTESLDFMNELQVNLPAGSRAVR